MVIVERNYNGQTIQVISESNAWGDRNILSINLDNRYRTSCPISQDLEGEAEALLNQYIEDMEFVKRMPHR